MAGNISNLIPQYVISAIIEIVESKKFDKPILNWSKGMEVGDGFSGQIFRVTISEDIANVSDSKSLTLIVKLPPVGKEHRRMAMAMFEREIQMYKTILPALKLFQLNILTDSSESFSEFPHCYWAHFNAEQDEAVIILEDLRERGFEMENKYKVIGFEHAKLTIRTIGKLHATSIAMKHKQPELFKPMTQLDDNFKDFVNEDMMRAMTEGNIRKTLKTLQKDGDDVYRKKLAWFQDNIIELSKSIWEAEPLAVPVHGDCWTNNYMFKNVNGHPTDIILIDWQMSRYISPAIDFCHFIFVCTDKTFRDQHYEELIEYYYETVRAHLSALGCDAVKVFPYDEFRNHLKKFGKFVLFVAMMALPIICTPNEDLPDLSKLMDNLNGNAENTVEFIDAFNAEKNVNFVSRMSDVVRDMVNYGYL